jgi:hypothetical protein
MVNHGSTRAPLCRNICISLCVVRRENVLHSYQMKACEHVGINHRLERIQLCATRTNYLVCEVIE